MKIRKESSELTKLRKKFKNCDKNTQNFVIPALEQLAFMTSELTKLATLIEEKGWTEKYQNGENQKGIKKSSAGEAYLSLMQRYNALFKTLSEYAPNDEGGEDELEKFQRKYNNS